jgi:hypothetical protein
MKDERVSNWWYVAGMILASPLLLWQLETQRAAKARQLILGELQTQTAANIDQLVPFDAKFGGLTLAYRADMGEVAAVSVDLVQWSGFRRCWKGPGRVIGQLQDCWPSIAVDNWDYWVCRELAPWCGIWDADGDYDVDLRDFAAFQLAASINHNRQGSVSVERVSDDE